MSWPLVAIVGVIYGVVALIELWNARPAWAGVWLGYAFSQFCLLTVMSKGQL